MRPVPPAPTRQPPDVPSPQPPRVDSTGDVDRSPRLAASDEIDQVREDERRRTVGLAALAGGVVGALVAAFVAVVVGGLGGGDAGPTWRPASTIPSRPGAGIGAGADAGRIVAMVHPSVVSVRPARDGAGGSGTPPHRVRRDPDQRPPPAARFGQRSGRAASGAVGRRQRPGCGARGCVDRRRPRPAPGGGRCRGATRPLRGLRRTPGGRRRAGHRLGWRSGNGEQGDRRCRGSGRRRPRWGPAPRRGPDRCRPRGRQLRRATGGRCRAGRRHHHGGRRRDAARRLRHSRPTGCSR
jgi:hypothetical protein